MTDTTPASNTTAAVSSTTGEALSSPNNCSTPADVTVVTFCVPIPADGDDLDLGGGGGGASNDPLSDAMGAASLDGGGGGGAVSSNTDAAPAKPLAMNSGPVGSGGKGVVGTVTFFGTKSALVWLGWGDLVVEGAKGGGGGGESADEGKVSGGGPRDLALGSGLPVMGPLAMATPRTKYVGAFSEREAPATQLASSPSEEDMVASLQMAARLSAKVGWPVLVSCSLNGDAQGMAGLGAGGWGGNLSQRASALAEREAGRVLLTRKEEVLLPSGGGGK